VKCDWCDTEVPPEEEVELPTEMVCVSCFMLVEAAMEDDDE
jgi:hypothetical protein